MERPDIIFGKGSILSKSESTREDSTPNVSLNTKACARVKSFKVVTTISIIFVNSSRGKFKKQLAQGRTLRDDNYIMLGPNR